MSQISAPPLHLWAAELPRGVWGVASLAWSGRKLAHGPKGDGRPILILPGLFNSDRSNFAMRRYLRRLGYRVEGWGLGRNLGSRTVGPESEKLFGKIRDLYDRTGEPVTLIGVSLGGMMARMAAHNMPAQVREVITISSPFAGSPHATNVWRAFEWLTGERIDDPRVLAAAKQAASPLPVRATAIWSRSDGLVNGLICKEGDGGCNSIEVRSSHLGVQLRPEVLLAIACTLAGADNRTAQ